MSGSPILPWIAAILTTRRDKQPVPLSDNDSEETLLKVECRSNMTSNTDTILFQVTPLPLPLLQKVSSQTNRVLCFRSNWTVILPSG